MGWPEIQEEFTRFFVWRGKYNVFIHRLKANIPHAHYHDHPWPFVTFILWGGYCEHRPNKPSRWRQAGSLLFRPAKTAHSVVTKGVAWSIIVTGPEVRKWRIFGDAPLESCDTQRSS